MALISWAGIYAPSIMDVTMFVLYAIFGFGSVYPHVEDIDPWTKAWAYFAIGSLLAGLAAGAYWTYLLIALIVEIFEETPFVATETSMASPA